MKNFARKILDWWYTGGRCFPWRYDLLISPDPWKVCSTAILLGKTKAENVSKIYLDFFNNFPEASVFLKANENSVKYLIKPTGLYNRKYNSLKKLAFFLTTKTFSCSDLFPLGQYTINSARMFLCKEKIIPIDAPILRILNRCFKFNVKNIGKLSDKEELFLRKIINKENPILLYWALVDLSDTICIKLPKCEICPIRNYCLYVKN